MPPQPVPAILLQEQRRLMTRSGTHRELSQGVDGLRLMRSTLSEMNGKAKPLPSYPRRLLLCPGYSRLKNILLNLKQSSETTLVYDRAPPPGRAFVRIPAREQVQRIQQVNHDVASLLSNSNMRFKQVAPWAAVCSINTGNCLLQVRSHRIQFLTGFVKVKT